MRPDFYISRNTRWDFVDANWPKEAVERLETALGIVRDAMDRHALTESWELPQAATDILDQLLLDGVIPELNFWYTLTKDWSVVIYELCHLSRGSFGVLMAEGLFVRGPGRNGKDTVCNKMHNTLGSYCVSISSETLCRVKDPDAPSPTMAKLRARRMVCVREVDTADPMKPYLYKKMVDPYSELQGRDLYEKLVVFNPQYLMFFASNEPMKIAKVDLAVKARTAVVMHVSIFSDKVVEANHVKWRDVHLHLDQDRPGDFKLMRIVYQKLLKGRSTRNVLPVPLSCQEQKDDDLKDASDVVYKEFMKMITSSIFPAGALEHDQVENVIHTIAPRLSPVDWLAANGFVRVRRKRGGANVYLYTKVFAEGQKAKYVCLADGQPKGDDSAAAEGSTAAEGSAAANGSAAADSLQ